MKSRTLLLTVAVLLTAACDRSDPEADQRVRILRAQLVQASAKINDLQAQVREQQDELDVKIGACCTSGGIAMNASDSDDDSKADDNSDEPADALQH